MSVRYNRQSKSLMVKKIERKKNSLKRQKVIILTLSFTAKYTLTSISKDLIPK
jgi:hypothetical protein